MNGFTGRIAAAALGVSVGLSCPGPAAAQEGRSADELVALGLRELQQIDAGRIGEVWDAGSRVLRERVPRERFIADATQARQTLGEVRERRWASVTRIRYRAGNTAGLPEGLYGNVDYSTDLAGGSTAYELLTFRLEPGAGWQLTGYIPRRPNP